MKKKLLSLMLVLIMSLTVACNKSEKKVEEVKERFSMSEKVIVIFTSKQVKTQHLKMEQYLIFMQKKIYS